MKTTLKIILLLLSSSSFGQTGDFIYKYELIINKQKENIIKIDTIDKIENSELSLEITDLKEERIPLATIEIESNRLTKMMTTDENGAIAINNLPQRNGSITISYVGMKTQIINFGLVEGKTILCKVSLAVNIDEPTIYVIHSKKKFTDNELHDLKKCLEMNESSDKCKTKDYYFSIQI